MGGIATDREAAAKYYNEALTQFDSVAQRTSHKDPDIERMLGATAAKIGGIELERGNVLAALSQFSRALQIAEAGSTTSAESRLNLAEANANVGQVLMRNGARAEAAAKLKKALGLYRELGQEDRAAAIEAELRP
jgi:tetratricopeptide (TPR) repeat protein